MLQVTSSLADAAHELLEDQDREWELLRTNRAALASLIVRDFAFDGFSVKAAFNPARMSSSLAKVDQKSISQRKCFLCPQARPAEQRGLDCGDGFDLFCNPFPILPEHFTIIHRDHRLQEILAFFPAMLDITRALGTRYTTFYNGPQCGASAPDHMHFQAGTFGVMPADTEADVIQRIVHDTPDLRVGIATDYLRPFVALRSKHRAPIEIAFTQLYHAFQRLTHRSDEPMLNVVATYDDDGWRVLVFPRVKHRPSFYFASDHTRMMLSPGTVDVGGLVTIVLEEDFNRLTREHLVQMFSEISVSRETLLKLVAAIR